MRRKQIASETVQILKQGFYHTSEGMTVNLMAQLNSSIKQTQCYTPEMLGKVREDVLSGTKPYSQTIFEVVNETSLVGAKRLVEVEGYQRVGVLNFASAKNPGGGFLNGAHAQEESLARSSGLYHSLLECPLYYDYHRSQKTCLYSDHMIHSPRCPIFREDNGTLLDEPYSVDFITSPAPNASAIYHKQPHNISLIPQVLQERSSKILSLAASSGCDALVLGAWGSGVFRNDPERVAKTFYEHLYPQGAFWGYFQKIVFSVLDTSSQQKTFKAFYDCYG
ncbi:MAG: TIGR02452 family protein [Candidatus Parabeggiatoa sp. nov. 3]|nr:MAG: TIGR02452 family protein [Gammaproteobacteria bacterium]RKZ58460.1 MAG: TIGR02452 family protein [Gammaproteobacteria bacterium]